MSCRRISGSQLPRLFECHASGKLPQSPQRDTVASRNGTIIHRYLAEVGTDPEAALLNVPQDLRPICQAIDTSKLPVNMSPEVSFAMDIDTFVCRQIGYNRDYSTATEREITCTVDVVGVGDGSVYIGDYKTGHGYVAPAARNWQLIFGAVCAAGVCRATSAVVEIIRIRDNGDVWRDRAEFTTAQLDEFAYDIAGLVKGIETKPIAELKLAEGEWCRFCNALEFCPKKRELTTALTNGDFAERIELMKPLDRDTAAHVWHQIKMAKLILKRAEERVRECVKEQGPIPLGDDRWLGPKVVKGNESFVGPKAFGVVAGRYGVDTAMDAATVVMTKKSIQDTLRNLIADKKLAKGSLGKESEATFDAIREAGGVEPGDERIEIREYTERHLAGGRG